MSAALGIALVAMTIPGRAAQPGEAVYEAKCKNCHGETGLASSGIGRAMHVKPITDPEVKSMGEKEMIDSVRDGMGKMQAYKGSLSEKDIRDSVLYFRTFLK